MIHQFRPKSKREWQAVIGINSEKFVLLVDWCKESHFILKQQTYEESLNQSPKGNLAKLKSVEELIFYTLMVLKSGITFDFAAFLLQFDQSRAHRQFVKGLHLIHNALSIRSYLPFRSFNSVEEFEAQFDKSEVLIFDATEQKIQRPQDSVLQRNTYSGKKKANTVKSMIISTLDKYVHYVSECYIGKTHDFSLLKTEFCPTLNWFDGYQIRVDLAYQGFKKDYPNATLYIPNKKPRGGQLSEEQLLENKKLGRQRIRVEHSIGGIKRYDILSTTSRIHDINIYNQLLASCAGLWNFFITR